MNRPSPHLASLLTGILYRSGLTRLAHTLQPHKACCLVLHRVATPATWPTLPNREFYLDTTVLGAILDHLVAHGWSVVTMNDAANRLATGQPRGKFVNISIDDGYRDTVEQAIPVFRSHGLPVTLYVTTGIPDGSLVMWTAGLETIIAERTHVRVPGGTVHDARTPAAKRALFRTLSAAWEAAAEASNPEQTYQQTCALNGFDPAALHARHALTWPMLETLRHDPLVEIGAHTISHRRLTTLTSDALANEIAGSRHTLQQRLGRPVQHFAYPFGQPADCGPREFAAAQAAGYQTAATTRRGLATPTTPPHALPRNTLNGAHRRAHHVELHLTGLGGLLARLRP